MKRLLITLCLQFVFIITFADKDPTDIDLFTANVSMTSTSPEIDGIVTDDEWQNAEIFKDFWEHWPQDAKLADYQTEVRVTYDNNFIFICAKLYDDTTPQIVQSLKRDGGNEFWRSDNFVVVIDPLNTKSTGYLFGVNAAGAQMEALLSVVENYTSVDPNWDNVWYSEVTQQDDFWIVEMAIPFSSMQYQQNSDWGINFVRSDMKRNLFSTWTHFPRNFQGIDLGHTGTLNLDAIPPISQKRFVIIPSLIDGGSENYEEGTDIKRDFNLGLDGKIAVNSSLKLDLTANPDFSQVEVDQQITNLSRFDPYFPEKRNFFLENSDIFSNLGTYESRPIFTRKIGLTDEETIPIYFGARLSGNITSSTRIGLMDVQTGTEGDINSENYGIFALQQNIFERSSIKTFFVNKQENNKLSFSDTEYNRVAGAEFHYLSPNGKFRSVGMYHNSFTNEYQNDNSFYHAGATYNSKNFYLNLSGSRMHENYLADVGFTPRLYNYDADLDTSFRLGYWQGHYRTNVRFFPEREKGVTFYFAGSYGNYFFNDDGSLNEYSMNFDYMMRFANMSNIYLRCNTSKVNLPFSTFIIDSDDPLPATEYTYNSILGVFNTPTNYKISGGVFAEYGGFYSGTKLTVGGDMALRCQPWGRLALDYRLNKVDLGTLYGKQDLHQFGAKTEIAFSNKMFWTTFVQYNTQIENFNINSRFQWRYRPMSDIYLVVTNNYDTYNWAARDLAIVLKVTYWLHL